jgi:hypothetical protein
LPTRKRDTFRGSLEVGHSLSSWQTSKSVAMANGFITSPMVIVNNLIVRLAQTHAISFLRNDRAEESFRK